MYAQVQTSVITYKSAPNFFFNSRTASATIECSAYAEDASSVLCSPTPNNKILFTPTFNPDSTSFNNSSIEK